MTTRKQLRLKKRANKLNYYQVQPWSTPEAAKPQVRGERFYSGRRRLAKKTLREFGDQRFIAFMWKWLNVHGLPKVDDVTHDCTGENHIITRVEIQSFGPKRGQLRLPQCYHSGGHIVCPCLGFGFQPPERAEKVLANMLIYATDAGRDQAASWAAPDWCAKADALVAGAAIVDERGIFVELKEKQ
jgi:hypothetical protein